MIFNQWPWIYWAEKSPADIALITEHRQYIAKRLNFDDIIYMSYSINFRRKMIFTMEEEGL
ncbi:hypothetical protein, partial [Arsenophonus endosymbiont of Bemisia tabaci]|uniref:hypothetical protein n=1 Tax=Arsenophonus endosymbiont of Bemisia tabaci TaxID=536059 RepID=UPI0015F611AD